jgi:cyanosortase A-associated protein
VLPNQQLRPIVLAITFVSTLLTLGQVTLDSNLGKYSAFTFPATLPLADWKPLDSKALNNQNHQDIGFISGRRYQYIQNDVALDIEMRYEATNGEFKKFLENYTAIKSLPKKPLPITKYQEGVGYYILFTDKHKAYLGSCINPRGGSTVSYEQFNHNRNTYDLKLNRIFPWLIGQEELRDWRCLWSYMSIPVNVDQVSLADKYQILEKTWWEWYQIWNQRFPKI